MVNVLIQINPEKIGYHAVLEAWIVLKSRKDLNLAIETLSKIPDVFAIVGLSGDRAIHVWALIRDVGHLLTTQDRIAAIPSFEIMEVDVNKYLMDNYPPIQFKKMGGLKKVVNFLRIDSWQDLSLVII